jgi:hypothetical protein
MHKDFTIAKRSVRLSNCASWHEKQVKIEADPRDKARHEKRAEELWLAASREQAMEARG